LRYQPLKNSLIVGVPFLSKVVKDQTGLVSVN